MARSRNRGRKINGILLLDKPQGMSSNQALQRVKYLFFAAKAGHTGSLDPLATGVLPICLGEATKFSQFLLEADKEYIATIIFGVRTNTGDSDGEILETCSTGSLTADCVATAMSKFRGEIEQVPSMYSALKHQGQPLYKLARKGVEVERHARPVTIIEFILLEFRPGERAEADVKIRCSKGTYVRTLAEDLGDALGVGAHVACLRRTAAGPFRAEHSIGLEKLEERRQTERAEDMDPLLLPMDSALVDVLRVDIPPAVAEYFRLGQPVSAPEVYRHGREGDIVRVFSQDGPFLGIGEVTDDGRLAPKRLVVQ